MGREKFETDALNTDSLPSAAFVDDDDDDDDDDDGYFVLVIIL